MSTFAGEVEEDEGSGEGEAEDEANLPRFGDAPCEENQSNDDDESGDGLQEDRGEVALEALED